jgi:hypothetical protein
MYIYKNLVTDDSCRGKTDRIIRKIRKNAGMLHIYLICLANNNDTFDLIDCKNLKQKGYPKNELFILGLADGRDSAIELAAQLFLKLSAQYGMKTFKEVLRGDLDTYFRRC